MKKLLSTTMLMVIWILGSSFGGENETLTKEDKKEIINYLKTSQSDLIESIKGLTDEQWTFKPNEESWSVAEICEHIIKAEPVVLKRVVNLEGMEYKPDQVEGYREKGNEMIEFIVGRSQKFQAPEPITPEGAYKTPASFIEAFKSRRSETKGFVKALDKPVKAYFENFGPVGEVSGYHWLMFISAHTERHHAQLKEVLANPDFPI
ncbi:DinB family protein [Ekhidna sp.]|uniref:DinB family protein n=1 Tax=Ekhidna sp. TaxID=2608089 RepID=UPI003C7CF4E2